MAYNQELKTIKNVVPPKHEWYCKTCDTWLDSRYYAAQHTYKFGHPVTIHTHSVGVIIKKT